MSIQVDLNSNNQVASAASVAPNISITNVSNNKQPAANPFSKASNTQKRLKLFTYGNFGTGKTYFALHFPSPVIIDMEKGSNFYADQFTYDRIQTTDCNELMSAIDYLLYNNHNYKTVIIDPFTVYWESVQRKWSEILLQKAIEKGKREGKVVTSYQITGLDWIPIKAELKRLIDKLLNLDMNVIIIAREKDLYETGGSEFMKKIGKTFDGEKNLPYLFDMVLNSVREDTIDPINKKIISVEYKAIVEKDRTNTFKQGEKIDLNYDLFKDKFGFESLNKEAKRVETITPDQIATINQLIIDKKVSDADLELAKRNYEIEDWSELTFALAEKVIGNLKKYSKKA